MMGAPIAHIGMALQTLDASSLLEFVSVTEGFDLVQELTVFRGQAVKGNLLPSIARKNRKLDTTATEKLVLEQMQLLGASLLDPKEASTLDLLVIAQHFGLKTRLLDWTSNPLAALWFACSDRNPGDVYVYALGADTLQKKDMYGRDPFTMPVTRVFQPRLNNPRILAQHGWFTLHRFSKTAKAFVPLDINPETKKHLTEIRVPGVRRQEVLVSLDRHGINERTLFPDLGGLCTFLNWKHKLS